MGAGPASTLEGYLDVLTADLSRRRRTGYLRACPSCVSCSALRSRPDPGDVLKATNQIRSSP